LPFGVNENLYKPLNIEKKYDVSFVGAWNPVRSWIIKRIRKAGFSVVVAGNGWPGGAIEYDEMIRLFNETRINLNLSNSRSYDVRLLLSDPIYGLRQLQSKKFVEQLKARHFEINACGAFQLSYYVDGLEHCYRLGEEIAIYNNVDEIIDKIKYYLPDEELREEIAQAAYYRTIKEHTYTKRFESIFSQIGLVSDKEAI
jgi:spore maturation protein CgeB